MPKWTLVGFTLLVVVCAETPQRVNLSVSKSDICFNAISQEQSVSITMAGPRDWSGALSATSTAPGVILRFPSGSDTITLPEPGTVSLGVRLNTVVPGSYSIHVSAGSESMDVPFASRPGGQTILQTIHVEYRPGCPEDARA
jgi:hypothetical protein